MIATPISREAPRLTFATAILSPRQWSCPGTQLRRAISARAAPPDRAHRPPHLYEKLLHTAPRLELYLCFVGFQGVAQSTAAVLSHAHSLPAAKACAAAFLVVFPIGFVLFVLHFLRQNARGPRARLKYVKVAVAKEEKKNEGEHGEQDDVEQGERSSKTKKKRKVRRHHKWVDQLRDGDDAQSLRREHGHPWVGFCDRWAPLVADFRAGAARWGGAPVGLPIMMAQKLVVGGT